MLYPDGVRQAIDTNLTLSGTSEAALLRGQVRVDQLQFTPEFDLTDLTNQFGAETTPPPSQGFSQNLQLDVSVQSTGGVNLVSRTLSLRAAANLNIRGTAAQPVVLGRINLNGGDMIFNGNRYILQSGTIDFVNPVQTQPVVNLWVNTTIQQYNIHMHFDGPVETLHTTYTSDPALPPADIIHLLAFGQTTESAAANPMPGNLGAESAIASQVSGQVTSRLEKIAGISQLSVDPLLGCNQQNRGACITVKQRVTGNIFVTFQTDVTSLQNDTVQLQYQATPRVQFSGTRDQNGGFGFDTRINKTW
jgi:translocation and assembly module TamB